MTSLPQELIEAIVDHLHDDTLTLKACASVSRIWTHRCRIHLLHSGVVFNFPDATVSPSESETKIKDGVTAFQHLLSTQPSMAEHVRSLEVRNLVWRLSEEWTHLLVEVMKHLRHVEHLTFRRVRWYFLTDAVKQEFGVILRLPTLISLSFDEFITWHPSTFPDLLILPPNLKDLQISEYRCIDHTNEATLPTSNHKRLHPLDSLSICMGAGVQATLLPQLLFGGQNPSYDAGAIRRLRLSETCREESVRFVWEAARPTLEEYEIVAGNGGNNEALRSTTSLRMLPRLKRLIVPHTYLEWLTDLEFVSHHDDPHPLEELHIMSMNLGSASMEDLAKLDDVMENRALGALRLVEVHVSDNAWTASSRNALLCELARLQSRGGEFRITKERPGY
ncbi:hypothetical protein LshimejAT787_0600260 [Lyophyllum shimeji]|uniref:F-box domain-containing protein n=1 Tax=Lyophyllum shimeji TaxID=47721 RepID=A0A9P3PNX0_LYOSH|nr:hypothetical protein LshimejAT787_0600260 [Lyophyllum shimeji]